MLELEQPDTESEDDEYDPSTFTFISQGTSWTQARKTHNATIDTFAALETDDNDSETDALEELNGWAQRVHVMKQKSSQISRGLSTDGSCPKLTSPKKSKAKALITREADLDAIDKNIISSLPRTGKAMAAAMKKSPSNELLGPGEMWVMSDSGVNIDAANIEEHLKDDVHVCRLQY